MYIDQKSVQNAEIYTSPYGFRYGFIRDFIVPDSYELLRVSFPDVARFKLVDKQSGGGRKRFYVGPTYTAGKNNDCACALNSLSTHWQSFFHECADGAFIQQLSKVMGVQFNTLCNFGLTYGNEGCVQEPHLDGAIREYDDSPVKSTWASIAYFNEAPDNTAGTCVYLPDRATVVYQAPSMRNGLFFFEQHPMAWHGFPRMQRGYERRILSLAYSSDVHVRSPKTSFIHRITCKNYWKRFRT